jgi:hypothetical protein
MTLMTLKTAYKLNKNVDEWKINRQVYFTDQQHANSRHLHYIQLTVIQNIYALQYMYGFAKTHNYINAHCTDISSTMYHYKRLTYIMGLRMLVTWLEMFLQNMFESERLTAHITAIWTLPTMYTFMEHQAGCLSERLITHITAIWTLPSM